MRSLLGGRLAPAVGPAARQGLEADREIARSIWFLAYLAGQPHGSGHEARPLKPFRWRQRERMSHRPSPIEPSPIEPDGLFDGLRWSSILRGAVLDNVLTFVVLLPIMLYFAGADAFAEDEESANRAMDRAIAAPAFLACSFVVGLSITVYAGFWASRRAGLLHVRHGGWTAVASAALGSLFLLVPGATEGASPPLWYDALAMALMIPAGVFGGWLASRADGPAA